MFGEMAVDMTADRLLAEVGVNNEFIIRIGLRPAGKFTEPGAGKEEKGQ